MSSVPSAPDARRGPSRQTLVSVVGALVGLAFAVALFRVLGPGTEVSTQLRGYVVQSDTAVEVEFELARDPGTPVVCVLRAKGASAAEVGRREARIEPSDRRSTVERVVVPTTERAVNGEVVGCREARAGEVPAP